MEITFFPIFPLQLVVFETEELKLHIFEPRYKKLIQQCETEQSLFGMPLVIGNTLQGTGTMLGIKKIENKYANGEMDIVCIAHHRFELTEIVPSNDDETAASAFGKKLPFIHNEDKELNLRITDLINDLIHFQNIHSDAIHLDQFQFYKWVHKCGLTTEKELEMVSLQTTYERQLYLLEHLKNLISSQEEIGRMKKMIQLNGHFKKLNQSF